MPRVRTLSLDDATHIFMSIQCWPPDLIGTIVATLARRAPRLRCMIFSAAGVSGIVGHGTHGGKQLSELVDAWGTVSQVADGIPTTWGFTEAVFIGGRSASGGDAAAAAPAKACRKGNRINRRASGRAPAQAADPVRCNSIKDVQVAWSVGIF